ARRRGTKAVHPGLVGAAGSSEVVVGSAEDEGPTRERGRERRRIGRRGGQAVEVFLDEGERLDSARLADVVLARLGAVAVVVDHALDAHPAAVAHAVGAGVTLGEERVDRLTADADALVGALVLVVHRRLA